MQGHCQYEDGHESEQAPGDGEGKTQEPGVLQPVESQWVRHDLATEPRYTPFWPAIFPFLFFYFQPPRKKGWGVTTDNTCLLSGKFNQQNCKVSTVCYNNQDWLYCKMSHFSWKPDLRSVVITKASAFSLSFLEMKLDKKLVICIWRWCLQDYHVPKLLSGSICFYGEVGLGWLWKMKN